MNRLRFSTLFLIHLLALPCWLWSYGSAWVPPFPGRTRSPPHQQWSPQLSRTHSITGGHLLLAGPLAAVPPQQDRRDVVRANTDDNEIDDWVWQEMIATLAQTKKGYANNSSSAPLTTAAANHVLKTWCNSKARTNTPNRCHALLQRMMQSAMEKSSDKVSSSPSPSIHYPPPDTTSFNIVLQAMLQQSPQQRQPPRGGQDPTSLQCQDLVDDMTRLHQQYRVEKCAPNLTTYMLLVKSFGRTRGPSAAARARALVQQLETRYQEATAAAVVDDDGTTTIISDNIVIPDHVLYNAVLTLCAQRDPRTCRPSLQHMERVQAAAANATTATPKRQILTTVSYNIVLDTLAKAGQGAAALKLLKRMPCPPDVVTYTSCIDALAKVGDGVAAEKLLNECEQAHHASGYAALLKPNIRTYTSVIHAYARGRRYPERAEQIVERLEQAYEAGHGVQPDTTCYNALLNAFGWATDYPAKARKCCEILEHMIELYESGQNIDAQPDLITCNSVLNAAAFSPVPEDPAESEEIMKIAVRTADLFAAGEYGPMNHVTFVNLLLATAQHMPPGPRRTALATTTFWQCCQSGNLSVPVVTALHKVLDWDDFEHHLGPALRSGPHDEKLRFQLENLPESWGRFAPKAKERSVSRPSRKSSNYQATKSVSLRTQRKRP